MDTSITGQKVEVTDRFREYATDKSEKIATLAEKAQVLEVRLSRHSQPNGTAANDRVELTLVGPGPVIRAEAEGPDKYAAFDLAFGRMLERVRRGKDRRKIHRGQHRPTSLHEASGDGFSQIDITPATTEVLDRVATGSIAVVDESAENEENPYDGYSPVVIRRKVFASTPMTVDDALYYMELVGHDFYLFIDSESNRPSVVYRRKGWDYGVIALDDDAPELQEEAVAARKINA
ncbi:ribosome hibernation-promoting factor, HPF/YfiA family [Herbiconiux sp. SYSU D00978]|uniref:ribosome hibernation-promoting factor, HPF/YfiA family n=1 Tax=Herbiconiux sp. SYSU D00978 TaxID=2812562 RepID=UPI001A973887|nr:ribosome-associated translation inhibitor RaiA [Herbiconiux sp. SYSU D00978]